MSVGVLTRSLALCLVIIGCGSQQNLRTEDLDAEEHEAEADREDREADAHLAQTRGVYYSQSEYNPLDAHLSEAATHREHASQHRERATELRAFEEAECAQFPPETREACPLLLHVGSVTDVEGGTAVHFAEDVPLEPVVAHLRCHLAFAAARGRDRIGECALYVPGVSLHVEGSVLSLTTDQPDQVTELRRRVGRQAP